MQRTLTVVGLATLLCALCAAFPSSNLNAASGRKVKTDVLIPSGMPVSVISAEITSADGRNLSALKISVTNESDGELNGLRLAVFIARPDVARPTEALKAGEGWREALVLPARSSKTFSLTLRGRAMPGDRAVVAVQAANGQAGAWGVSLTDIFSVAPARGQKGELPPAQFVSRIKDGAAYVKTAALPQGAFCREALKNASESCKAGVDSFSCDEKNQTFAYTCKTVPFNDYSPSPTRH